MFARIANSPSRSLATIALAWIAGLALAYFLGFVPSPARHTSAPLVFPRFSQSIRDSAGRMLPEPHAGFIAGLLTGGTAQLSPDFRAAVVATGTVHLMALSGWNIGVVSRGFERMLRACTLRRRARLALCGAGIVLFVLVAGATASVIRAAIMGIIVIVADLLGRPNAAGRALLVTGAVMLSVHPYLIADLSFLLSFSATLGLIYIAPLIEPAFSALPRFFGVRDNAVASTAAMFATAPLIILAFGRFSFSALPANILLLPFIPVAMGAGFLLSLAGILFDPLAQVIAPASGAIIGYCIAVIRLFARIPWGNISDITFNAAAATVMAVGMTVAVIRDRYVLPKT